MWTVNYEADEAEADTHTHVKIWQAAESTKTQL